MPINPIEQQSTEDKIKNIARDIFLKKGFSGTKTRDIADAAGVNLALLNYYFRSKEKLFQSIFVEEFIKLFQRENEILETPNIDIFDKIDLLIKTKIELLIKNPDLPAFVFKEMEEYLTPEVMKINGLDKSFASCVLFEQQLKSAIKVKKIRPITSVELRMYINGLIVFPFIAKQMIIKMIKVINADFTYENYLKSHTQRVIETVNLYLKHIN